MMSPALADVRDETDEDYLVSRAKAALTVDAHAAKAWMVTAKTLYPNNFAVQFEAYNIVKSAKNVKEAAKCFETLLHQFQGEAELWIEVEALTKALRSDCGDPEPTFLRAVFANLSTEAQQQLLQVTADRSKDTMEHCRLLMLLLSRFPHAVAKHGPRLVDTLISAEKHSHHLNAINCYRKLLVCDLVPLMGASTASVELPSRQLYRLLHKTIEYYLCCLMTQEASEPDPWGGLFQAFQSLGCMLGWDMGNVFSQPWSRDLLWQHIVDSHERNQHPLDPESSEGRQIVYWTGIFFLRCLHEYVSTLHAGERQLVLLESFIVSPSEWETSEPPLKRRKGDESSPLVTMDTLVAPPSASSAGPQVQQVNPSAGREWSSSSGSIVGHLYAAVRCWNLINSSEILRRGVTKLLQVLGVDAWLSTFHQDMQLHRGEVDELVNTLLQAENPEGQSTNQVANVGPSNTLVRNLRLASAFYYLKQLPAAVDRALQVVGNLGNIPCGGKLSVCLLQPTRQQRHLHFLPLARAPVLQYCVHLILSTLQQFVSQPIGGVATTTELDMCVGNMMVLLQLELGGCERPLPGATHLLIKLMAHIRSRTSFSYPIFTNYVINSDILEEIMHLSTKQGGSVAFEITPPSSSQLASQRRISTRGVDKGAKEDFKSAMRRQMARSGEALEPLLIRFLTSEQDYVRRLLWPPSKTYMRMQ